MNAACVQPTHTKTVVFTLHTEQVKNIRQVALRGDDKPLNWQNDMIMKQVQGDSVYQATITFKTGYLFTEVKFLINGEFELKEKGNRRINFSAGDTTYYTAIFNQLNAK
jgi:putative oxidoreductase